MQELLTNAWQGWQRYTDDGKYAALLFLVLLFLWFRREEAQEKLLLVYTTLITILCVCPISAAVLMIYQTRFYDYEWIWNYVPLTLLVAYGGALFLTKYWEYYQKSVWKCIGITMAVVVLVCLCGSMGERGFDGVAERQTRVQAQQTLDGMLERTDGEEICLWAPKEIMETARAYDGNIRLVYGRDMWDAALGAYTYDTYGEMQETLYRWMTWVQESSMQGHFANEPTEEDIVEGGVACLEIAQQLGVNTVLLPGNILPEDMEKLADMGGLEPIAVDGYYLIIW